MIELKICKVSEQLGQKFLFVSDVRSRLEINCFGNHIIYKSENNEVSTVQSREWRAFLRLR